jgi:hypothetical protein
MGARMWEYHASFRNDPDTTLQELRQSEFMAGRFYGSELHPKSIDEAVRIAGATGTRSILDIRCVTAVPTIGAVSPVPTETLSEVFGSERPSRSNVLGASTGGNEAFEYLLQDIGRGEARFIITYEGEEPTGVSFFGYSCD